MIEMMLSDNCNMLLMFYVVKCILMNYMLNLLTVKSHPFCVYVASTVGNVQVIKIRGVREWTPQSVSRCSDT